ncbi:hypothetical protein XA68_14283 [Ophiocordyceps unilateralis]|uniref:AAA+ ATPase domain-containing protein n=1 Tax=Ophiocordyceps unilateralis TaxID=268505 RepID=A0A2A9PLQ3_OPHUN|nr:hypothetical protein XA68_14283 [Ophiocordyceps unilateralis]
MARGRVGEPPSDKFHPFFAKATRNEGPSAPAAGPQVVTSTAESGSALNSGDENRRKKRRKTEPATPDAEPEARKPRGRRKKGILRDSLSSSDITNHTIRDGQCSSTLEPKASGSAELAISTSHLPTAKQPAATIRANASQLQDRPQETKRLLKFNPKTGTLGSPPNQKQSQSPSLLVCIQYGHDDESRQAVGAKVTQILDGEVPMPDSQTKNDENLATNVSNIPSAQQDGERKTTHPFFTGKAKSRALEQTQPAASTQKPAAPRNSVFMSTPVSPRKQRNPLVATGSNNMARFGIKSMGVKVPGAMHPMWPAAGMSHVRGCESMSDDAEFRPFQRSGRKSKGLVTAIAPRESILTRLLNQLDLKSVHRTLPRDEESFAPAPPELRLPRRRFESGRVLQNWIRPRLTSSSLAVSGPDESSEDELSAAPLPKAHAAIFRHYHSLRTNLSAFDRSSCESQAWTQKYAPVTAAQVLQAGKELALLKQWLEALKVQSVDAGNDSSVDKSKVKSGPSSKTRRKRRAKLQGFVVDSDDEANETDELSEIEDETVMADTGPIKRSLIRSGDADSRHSKDLSKLRNTIVISGPHGCGKTAAVYAVAKEIGFEVFEINSSSRRSGKDILEKVGDMTRNHLVQQHRNQPASASSEADEAPKEPKPMTRGPMSSFLKPKPTTGRPKLTACNQQGSQKARDKSEASPQSQKQSLILLEEADVLYEEDKQFWQTLMGMMMQSKRPFVVTCSDESLIPLQSLSLHGIFRFTPPRANLAVDVCLLIAANEGHALERKAVESLYRSRGNDLRATISELNYWCQMGIGDRRGGSDWFYPRWPRGSDVDSHGDVIRVISEGAFLHGMGWIGRDHIATAEPRAAEEDALWQAWDCWRVDMGDWSGWCDVKVATPAKSSSSSSSSARRRVNAKTLAAYDEFFYAMSSADLCAGGAFGTLLEESIDCTLPELPGNVRDDFIVGRTLLEADPTTLTVPTKKGIAITMKSLARAVLVRSKSGRSSTVDADKTHPVDEHRSISILDASFRRNRPQLTRHDLSFAFDPIATSAKAQILSYLEPSVFDRTLRLIVLDVAPWIRSIIAFERRLMRDRAKLSNLLSQSGGPLLKRRRTTRAAYSALEGGERRTTRREKYFGSGLLPKAVMRTGAASFIQGMGDEERVDGDEASE